METNSIDNPAIASIIARMTSGGHGENPDVRWYRADGPGQQIMHVMRRENRQAYNWDH